MTQSHPDSLVMNEVWSDLAASRAMPEIDADRLHAWRSARLKAELKKADAALLIAVNPLALRYGVEYRTYPIFQGHTPMTYLFFPQGEGPSVLYGGYGTDHKADQVKPGRGLTFFDVGYDLSDGARLLADDVVTYLKEIGSDNRRVALEYANPSITQALLQRGLEVIDGIALSEGARQIKNEDEINCIRWSCAVAELGIAKMREALQPGISELQLWGLLNYTNLANNGDWHEGRMLASGPRINPWLQEASPRKIEAGDLVGFDTDMVGPFGYCADISRTFFCGPGAPSKRQKELYRLALEEITFNLKLIKPGLSFADFQRAAYLPAEEFHAHTYPCTVHGVGMCDEFPYIRAAFLNRPASPGHFEPGMVVCVESFMGAVGEADGVKLEQQIVITDDGYDLLSLYPFEEDLLG